MREPERIVAPDRVHDPIGQRVQQRGRISLASRPAGKKLRHFDVERAGVVGAEATVPRVHKDAVG